MSEPCKSRIVRINSYDRSRFAERALAAGVCVGDIVALADDPPMRGPAYAYGVWPCAVTELTTRTLKLALRHTHKHANAIEFFSAAVEELTTKICDEEVLPDVYDVDIALVPWDAGLHELFGEIDQRPMYYVFHLSHYLRLMRHEDGVERACSLTAAVFIHNDDLGSVYTRSDYYVVHQLSSDVLCFAYETLANFDDMARVIKQEIDSLVQPLAETSLVLPSREFPLAQDVRCVASIKNTGTKLIVLNDANQTQIEANTGRTLIIVQYPWSKRDDLIAAWAALPTNVRPLAQFHAAVGMRWTYDLATSDQLFTVRIARGTAKRSVVTIYERMVEVAMILCWSMAVYEAFEVVRRLPYAQHISRRSTVAMIERVSRAIARLRDERAARSGALSSNRSADRDAQTAPALAK